MLELEAAVKLWVASFEAGETGEPIRLDPGSVVLHRIKDFGDEWLWFLTCLSLPPKVREWEWSGVAIHTEEGSWWAAGFAGSEGFGTGGLTGGSGDVPTVNLGAQFLPDGFRAGGRVAEAQILVDSVRITDLTGAVIEDAVQNRVALFRANRPLKTPLLIELVDSTGHVIATDSLV